MLNKKPIIFGVDDINLATLRLQIDTVIKLRRSGKLSKSDYDNLNGVLHLLDCIMEQSGIDITDSDKLFINNHFSVQHIGDK